MEVEEEESAHSKYDSTYENGAKTWERGEDKVNGKGGRKEQNRRHREEKEKEREKEKEEGRKGNRPPVEGTSEDSTQPTLASDPLTAACDSSSPSPSLLLFHLLLLPPSLENFGARDWGTYPVSSR